MATILITDERTLNRRYLATVLTHEGHHVLEAESAAAGLALVRSARPDLILIDVLMPHPGGYQFVRQLRRITDTPLPRVVFLAAPYMVGEARLLALACGVCHVVADVDDINALLDVVANALEEMPPGQTEALADNGDDNALYPMVSRLYGRVAELETFNARLERNAAAGAAQLAVARSALDREISKRLWTEQDMTQENQRLRAQAVRDPLTGLYNRRYLEESLAREESRAKRSGQPLSMMMIDIDHFKRCNDTFGHAAGDEVLRAISRCMESLARTEDILCRYGGEEFVLVMTNTAMSMLQQRADALRAGVPKLNIEYDRKPIGPITLSIGLAIFPDCGDSIHAVLQAADAALYQAKTTGRDRVVIGGPGIDGRRP